MSYPCSPNLQGKSHRMGGARKVDFGFGIRRWVPFGHPNPGKINFRRADPRHPKAHLWIPTVKVTREELREMLR